MSDTPSGDTPKTVTLLEKLKHDCVFRVNFKEDAFVVTEMCDEYFTTTLTPAELKQLGEELIALASQHDTGTLAPTT